MNPWILELTFCEMISEWHGQNQKRDPEAFSKVLLPAEVFDCEALWREIQGFNAFGELISLKNFYWRNIVLDSLDCLKSWGWFESKGVASWWGSEEDGWASKNFYSKMILAGVHLLCYRFHQFLLNLFIEWWCNYFFYFFVHYFRLVCVLKQYVLYLL